MSFMDFQKGASQGFAYFFGLKSGQSSFLHSRHFISMNRHRFSQELGTTGLFQR
jgi:hypothetical protein